MEFECRFIHDWTYNQTLYRQVRRRNRGTVLFWSLFLVFSAGMAVYCFCSGGGFTWPCALYGLLFVASLLQVFGGPVLLRRAWKKNCLKWGRERFETTVTLGDSVHYTDDTGMEADIPWDKVAELERSGGFFVLRGEKAEKRRKKKVDYLYFPLSGFSDGSGAALLDWIAREHPEVALTGDVSA